ncbi:MAG: hypothetical protein HC811_01040 [Flammeovirgaceae bacterium]|nr:hypothetical protein [Flammeovirgaceae bacterium]
MKRILLIPLFILIVVTAVGQKVFITKVELAGEKIIVHYNLEDSNPGSEYLLSLYTSRDNFAAPVVKVTGDVGSGIKPGSNKKIEWSIIQDYGAYKGKIALEIRGRIFIPFAKFSNTSFSESYKRGKSYTIHWNPGANDPINIELYKGESRVSGEVNKPNTGSYVFQVPSKTKPGKDYRLKFTSTRNSDEVLYSSVFAVKPKTSMVIKVVPIVVAGVVAYLLIPKPDEDIDDPPLPDR